METNPEHATLLRVELDGSEREIHSRGLRNTIGFGWHPDTGELWGMDHGSDWLGNDAPPEELNRLEAGADYGWPFCYGKREIDPVIADPPDLSKAEYCALTEPSVLEYQAHGAPIGLVFYTGSQFPDEYRNDAFIALHGSWNRLPPTGYGIARIHFEGGVPHRVRRLPEWILDRGRRRSVRPPRRHCRRPRRRAPVLGRRQRHRLSRELHGLRHSQSGKRTLRRVQGSLSGW
jgi:glucose/arabinose dehydrogenase